MQVMTESMSKLTLAIASTTGSVNINELNILPDITATENRNHQLLAGEFLVGVPSTSSPVVYQYTAQAYSYGLGGEIVALGPPKALSQVNPTRIPFRIPAWLTGPVPAGASTTMMALVVTSSEPIAGVPTTIGFTIRTKGRLTLPAPNTF